ncbi:hypothetical protein AAE250_07745 [Bacteroides sp. GD17]|jgi:hypothetical protein|uniref:hypothetical protein n=1 Tax=Bacteroides sp. GD17 TaxID=3139826 RepID=UPI00313D9189
MKATKHFLLSTAIALLALTACTPNDDDPGNDPNSTKGQLSISALSLDGHSVQTRSSDATTYSTNTPITAFQAGAAVALRYNFSGEAFAGYDFQADGDGSQADAAKYSTKVTYGDGNWTVEGYNAATNPLRPNNSRDSNPNPTSTETWAGAQAMLWFAPGPDATADNLPAGFPIEGISADDVSVDLCGMKYLSASEVSIPGIENGKYPVRAYADALMAVSTGQNANGDGNANSNASPAAGSIVIDRDLDSSTLGAIQANLVHPGALMQLAEADITISRKGIEEGEEVVIPNSGTLVQLWAEVTVDRTAAATKAADDTDGATTKTTSNEATFFVPFSRTTTTGGGTLWQAIVPGTGTAGSASADITACVKRFAAQVKWNGASGISSTRSYILQQKDGTATTNGKSLGANLRYPLKLNISEEDEAHSTIIFIQPGRPGWGNADSETELVNLEKQLSVAYDSETSAYTYTVKGAHALQTVANWMQNGGTPPLQPADAPAYDTDADIAARMKTNITLTNDISLPTPPTADGSNWTPIGTNNIPYTGTFDGGGHQISNLVCIKGGIYNYDGLFLRIGTAGTVKNLILKDLVINNWQERNISGGIAAVNNGTIKNVILIDAVINSGGRDQAPYSNCGGIAGTNSGTIKNCHLVVSGIESKGIVMAGDYGSYAGGIVGENQNGGTITACSYSGIIIDAYNQGAGGGIVGWNKNTSPSSILACCSMAEGMSVVGRLADNAPLPQGCYPANNAKLGSIADLNNNVHLMNAIIYGGNNIENEDRLPFHYEADGDNNTPPTLTTGAFELKRDLGIDVQDDNTWQISTSKGLTSFAYVVSAGGNNAKLNAKLMEDITLDDPTDAANGSNWTTIAGTKAEPYTGTFDGGGYKIKNLVMRTATKDVNNALFAYIGIGATVKDLALEDAVIVSTYSDGATSCAGIAIENSGIIANCHFVATGIEGKGVVTSDNNNGSNTAGIVVTNSGIITGCSNNGKVAGTSVGGIAQKNDGGTIMRCSNSGTIMGTNSGSSGGIVQYNNGTIVGCSNSGTLTGDDAHGIAGYDSPYSNGQFIACYTTTAGSNIANTSLDRIKGCYPTNNKNFGETGGDADGTGSSSIEDLNQNYVKEMNTLIYAYNRSAGTTAEKKFLYHYTAGSSSDLPTLASGEPGAGDISINITPGSGGNADTWQISTLKDLQAFAAVVNLGGDNTKLNATLTDNITMPSNSSSWTPMKDYAGCFDGNGKAIQGLNVDGREGDFGLFANITDDGSVKDLTLVNAIINASSGSATVGGIAVRNRGTITNCNISGSLNNDKGKCGGIVAENVGIIMACTNSSTVTNNNDNCGGIAGDNTGSIIACTNSGTITRKDRTDYVGGITGYSSGAIIACTNNGKITGKDSTDGAGGVVGYNNTDNTRNVISCYTITSDSRVLNSNTNGSSPARYSYPTNNNKFGDTGGAADGTGTSSIEDLNNNYVSTLNDGIKDWNNDKQPTDAQYCNYHFVVGDPADTTPPKLVEDAPQ